MAGTVWRADIQAQLREGARLLEALADDVSVLERGAELLIGAFKTGHKLLLCGNGGSAADAQHVATELTARYKRERPALPAIALGTDVTLLTAMSNDYSFDRVFSRQIEALGRAGDVLWAFSTSGNSPNVLRAVDAARQAGMARVGFSGLTGGKLAASVELSLCVASTDTARIQEVHMAAAHIMCDLVEQAFTPAAEPAIVQPQPGP